MERQPDWDYWNALESLEVWQAVALSVGRDPATGAVAANQVVLVKDGQKVNEFIGMRQANVLIDALAAVKIWAMALTKESNIPLDLQPRVVKGLPEMQEVRVQY